MRISLNHTIKWYTLKIQLYPHTPLPIYFNAIIFNIHSKWGYRFHSFLTFHTQITLILHIKCTIFTNRGTAKNNYYTYQEKFCTHSLVLENLELRPSKSLQILGLIIGDLYQIYIHNVRITFQKVTFLNWEQLLSFY